MAKIRASPEAKVLAKGIFINMGYFGNDLHLAVG
jgi:hypothetical protein